MKKMRRCNLCGSYTIDESHCGNTASNPHPPKFSLLDRYASYRRAALG